MDKEKRNKILVVILVILIILSIISLIYLYKSGVMAKIISKITGHDVSDGYGYGNESDPCYHEPYEPDPCGLS